MAIDVSKQVAKADAAFEGRKYDLAIEIYLQALQIDPDNRAARRGVRLAALKKTEHAYPSKMSIKISTAGAWVAMRNPNAESKMIACENYLKIDPKNTDVAHTLAKTAEKAGYVNAAIGVYEAMATYAPKEEEGLVNLGRLLGPKDPEAAIGYLERALAVNPKNQNAIKLRKDLAAELSIKRTGFETARHTHDLLRDKGKTMERLADERIQKDEDQAEDQVTRAQREAERNPQDRHAQGRLAKAYTSASRHDDAIAVYKRILEANPGDFDALSNIGDLRMAQVERAIAKAQAAGETDRIKKLETRLAEIQVEEFKLRVAEHPTDLGLRFSLGEALQRCGRVDEAVAEFQKAVKDPRKRFDSLLLLGECFLAKSLFDLAARQLERALEESPGLSSEKGKAVVYNLGLLREKQGDVPAAKEHYLQVYEVDVSFRDVADKVMQLSGQ